jgi:hypothetical protein
MVDVAADIRNRQTELRSLFAAAKLFVILYRLKNTDFQIVPYVAKVLQLVYHLKSVFLRHLFFNIITFMDFYHRLLF